MRMVSLVPSHTETLVAWGLAVVGRTRFCLHGSCPPLGGTKDPDVRRVMELAPDLIVANHEENRAEDVAALEAAGLHVLVTDIRSLADAAAETRRLGGAVERAVEAETLATVIEAIPRDEPRLPAVCFIWRRPWMAVGPDTYAHDVLAAAGFLNTVTAPRYPEMSLEEARALGATVALLPSEPYPFSARQIPEVEAVFGPGRAVLLDGQALTWYGPRTASGVEELRRARRQLEAT